MAKKQAKQTNGEFKIERGVKMPPRLARQTKYPWVGMKPGESFIVRPNEGESLHALQNRVSSATRYTIKRNLGKFATRQMDGGVRIWRIE